MPPNPEHCICELGRSTHGRMCSCGCGHLGMVAYDRPPARPAADVTAAEVRDLGGWGVLGCSVPEAARKVVAGDLTQVQYERARRVISDNPTLTWAAAVATVRTTTP